MLKYVPSLCKHVAPNSWVSASSLHGPEKPGKVFRGVTSRLGDNNWPGMSNSCSHSVGEAFYKIKHKKINTRKYTTLTS